MRTDVELLRDALRALNSQDAFQFTNTEHKLVTSHDVAHEITLRLLWINSDKILLRKEMDDRDDVDRDDVDDWDQD